MRPSLRTALALSAAACVALAGAASAADPGKGKGKGKGKGQDKPVCNLITDAAGDVAVPSDNLDVVSADVASDARRLTAVLRVKKLATSDGTAPTGVAYTFRFMLAGSDVRYYLLASAEPSPLGATTFEFGTVEAGNALTPLGDATGKLDLARSEVRITAPTSFGSVRIKPGTQLVSLQAVTQRRFVVLLSAADSSVVDQSTTYTAGTPSCVEPGP